MASKGAQRANAPDLPLPLTVGKSFNATGIRKRARRGFKHTLEQQCMITMVGNNLLLSLCRKRREGSQLLHNCEAAISKSHIQVAETVFR